MIRKNKRTILLIVTGLVLVTLAACDPSKKYRQEEEATIQNYLSQNSDKNFELKPSGLYYREVQVGTGVMPVTNDTVYLKYSEKFLDGTVFNYNLKDGATDTLIFPLNNGWVIQGLDEGINYMRVGGSATFLLPSDLAFGTAGSYPYIPGYTPLLFEVQLLRVKSYIAK
jgi:FKBP-type peptidyl-prolyl cis-trans isomerase